MNVADQVDLLVSLGVHELAGLSRAAFTVLADDLGKDGGILAVHPTLVPASALAPLIRHDDKPGFVVEDMTDLDEFVPTQDLKIPDRGLYLLRDIDRGDDMRNWSPDEAAPAIQTRGQTPLTISEGISWLLQAPDQLVPNFCFMTIGSRKPKGTTLDARTPAIWISGGTGRDGAARRAAPKVGWCWAGNRHTWLGFASTAERLPLA